MTDSIDFVVFSDDWGRHPSSCQHLFRRIRQQHRVLWVNTIGLRAAKADSFTFLRGLEKLKEWSRPLKQVHENMWVLAPIMLPVTGQGFLGSLNRWQAAAAVRRTLRRIGLSKPVLFASVPTAIDYVGRLGESAVVYYITDDYSLWPGGNAEQIRRADRDLAVAADLILPCNQILADVHADCRGAVDVLPHAVDAEHFATPGMPEPDDMPAGDGPRLCFFGLIYEKIDLPLLAELARKRSDVQIVLVGPVKADTSVTEGLGNIHFLGPRNYEQLPAYLQAMDVLMVPYVRDEETLRKGPLKIRECLAAGKPTVALRIPDLEQYEDLVVLYDEKEQFEAAIDRALAQRKDPTLGRQMRERIAADTWQARVEQIQKWIPRILNRPEGDH